MILLPEGPLQPPSGVFSSRCHDFADDHSLPLGLEQFIAKGPDEEVAIEFDGDVLGLDGHGYALSW